MAHGLKMAALAGLCLLALASCVRGPQSDPDVLARYQTSVYAPPEDAAPLTGASVDMETAVTRALEANPQIAAAKALYRAAAEGEKSALGAMGPSLNVMAFAQAGRNTWAFPNSGLNVTINGNSKLADVNVHQPLFTGFNLLSTYQKAALAKDSADAGIAAAEVKLALDVRLAFLSLLKARSDVKTALDSVERVKAQLYIAESFYEVGIKPLFDVLQAKTDLAKAEQNLIAAKNSVDTYTTQLLTYLNLPITQEVDYQGRLAKTAFTQSLASCQQTAQARRPDLTVAVKSVQMAAKDARIALSGIYPQIAADFDSISGTWRGDVNADNINFDQQTYQAKVSLQWTAWDWGKTYFGYTQAQAQADKIFADYVKLLLTVGLQIQTSYLDIVNAAKLIDVAEDGLAAARESWRMAMERYEAQVGTSADVITAQARMTQAEGDLNQALSDYQKAVVSMAAAMGEKTLAAAAK